jgi:DNA (cytosine-5)-methyltransferase 1
MTIATGPDGEWTCEGQADLLELLPRPRALDLYCGAGGASMGYHLAGWDVTGVDNEPHPDYPFRLLRMDAKRLIEDHTTFLDRFDLVVGSPPCKTETDLAVLSDREHPDLLTPTLAVVRRRRQPFIIENVASTKKMTGPVVLCGASFGLGATCRDGVYRHLERHRKFESNLPLMSPGCACPKRQPVGVYGTGGGGQMTRGYKAHPEEAREAMGIDWMKVEDICQAIPPAYTKYLGEQALELIGRERAA